MTQTQGSVSRLVTEPSRSPTCLWGNFIIGGTLISRPRTRFEAILKQYPDMDIAGDALYYLALTYKEIGAGLGQRKTHGVYGAVSAHQYAATGQKILAALNAKHPAEFVAQASPSSPEATKVAPVVHGGSLQEPTKNPSLRPAPSIAAESGQAIQSGGTTLCRVGVWC